jgi:hypothetical protein
VTVVVGSDDLVEGELAAAVIPAGEADVVGVVAFGEVDEVAGSAGEQCVGGGVEVEPAVVAEPGGDGVEDVVRRGAGAADDDEFGVVPRIVETDRIGPGWLTVVFDDVDRVPAILVDIVDDLGAAPRET